MPNCKAAALVLQRLLQLILTMFQIIVAETSDFSAKKVLIATLLESRQNSPAEANNNIRRL
jgi:hypothetical protein